MNEQFTVPQDHGKGSTVEVTQEIRDTFAGSIRMLHFYTDQSLASNSGRAWNVKQAIERYCRERGYRITQETQHAIEATYSAQAHSQIVLDALRKQIQTDGRYAAALAQGQDAAAKVQASFGPAIAQLKAMVTALESKARREFTDIAIEVGDVQAEVIADLDLPPHLLPSDQDLLHRPLYRPEFDHYARYPGTIYALDLDTIMALAAP